MKKLFSLLLLVFAVNTYGQTYLNESARWTQTFYYSGFTNSTNCNITLFFDGDSVVNGKSYWKLYDSSTCYLITTQYDSLGEQIQTIDTSESYLLRAMLREENRKVYRLNTDGTEYWFYNFYQPDYALIDSVAQYNSCTGGSVNMLIEDTVCIGNIGRKRWRVSMSQYPLAQYFIEGVGPSSGFLAPVCRNGCPECGYTLNSFVLNGDTLYQGTCSIVADVKEIEKKIVLIQSPESLTFEGGNLEQISIYNLNLQLVAEQKYSANKMTFDISTYQNGVYLFSGIFEGKRINGKFLIIGK